jgi:MoaA/NifB/PqqE/SkfB family radical SAM enzyme
MTDSSRLFCSKPFTWFEVSRGAREGDVFLCCPSWLDTPVGNLTDQSVSDIWNGPVARDIRRSILDGSFEYCSRARCPYLQTASAPVQRVEDVTDPELATVIRDGLTALPYGPREINCSYDRSCNLSCPSCRTGLIMETARKDEILTIQRKLTDEALGDARLLYITGSGDPFGSPYFRRWLQTMRREEMPRLEKIRLHSNGLLWTPRMWLSIPAEIRDLVKYADISIDAASPQTYAVNRRGGDFSTLRRNLDFIAGLRRTGPLEWLGINMVVQENNFREMPDFVRLGKALGVDTVALHQLVNWGTFGPEEFASRAVHAPAHPRHKEFTRLLGDPTFDDPIVYLSNLTTVARKPAGRLRRLLARAGRTVGSRV